MIEESNAPVEMVVIDGIRYRSNDPAAKALLEAEVENKADQTAANKAVTSKQAPVKRNPRKKD